MITGEIGGLDIYLKKVHRIRSYFIDFPIFARFETDS